ncbi:hypothetical protein [Kitasatospora viridis]|uniref:Uncharacterized protein n=1 Tax=Kitasatospora viridis TaxID=281105 RepID=A0A561T794_9ACTN|nr:hypothetical protein [Kitasatospora viridis]TWF82972.1 hypothetical protein FHX73_14455 [Kitasatospora viridis]
MARTAPERTTKASWREPGAVLIWFALLELLLTVLLLTAVEVLGLLVVVWPAHSPAQAHRHHVLAAWLVAGPLLGLGAPCLAFLLPRFRAANLGIQLTVVTTGLLVGTLLTALLN